MLYAFAGISYAMLYFARGISYVLCARGIGYAMLCARGISYKLHTHTVSSYTMCVQYKLKYTRICGRGKSYAINVRYKLHVCYAMRAHGISYAIT